MIALIALIVLSIVRIDSTKIEVYDLVEVNHEYNDNGKLFCSSVILRDWNIAAHTFVAQDYRRYCNVTIQRDWANGGYIIQFIDETDTFHYIRVKQKTETWTQHWPLDNEQMGERVLYGPRPCEAC